MKATSTVIGHRNIQHTVRYTELSFGTFETSAQRRRGPHFQRRRINDFGFTSPRVARRVRPAGCRWLDMSLLLARTIPSGSLENACRLTTRADSAETGSVNQMACAERVCPSERGSGSRICLLVLGVRSRTGARTSTAAAGRSTSSAIRYVRCQPFATHVASIDASVTGDAILREPALAMCWSVSSRARGRRLGRRFRSAVPARSYRVGRGTTRSKPWPRVAVACVRSGISGWVIGS
jgi:hypothetical protein